jgi:hypothetical protein
VGHWRPAILSNRPWLARWRCRVCLAVGLHLHQDGRLLFVSRSHFPRLPLSVDRVTDGGRWTPGAGVYFKVAVGIADLEASTRHGAPDWSESAADCAFSRGRAAQTRTRAEHSAGVLSCISVGATTRRGRI